MAGLFIVFEGGEAAGKTTQTTLLAEHLRAAGQEVVLTRQPGGTSAGTTIRQLLLSPDTGELSPRAEALLYAADKAQHVAEVVRPALAAGKVVVCDRYVDSTLAYQGAGRLLEPADLERLSDWATGGLVPDLTVLLDVPVDVGVGAKRNLDRIEQAGADFHARVRAWFLELARREPARYLVLGARKPREQIAAAVAERVDALLALRAS